MGPIDRIRARSEALRVLGLGQYANDDDIRAAWKRAVKETHPDRNSGDDSSFIYAKSAYEHLCGDLDDETWHERAEQSRAAAARPCGTARPTRPAASAGNPRRPSVSRRTITITAEAARACHALLSENRVERETAGAGDLAECTRPDAATLAPEDHVLTEIRLQGRNVVFVVPTPLVEGVNRVAFPSAVLQDPNKVRPKVLRLQAASAGSGEIEVPARSLEALLPGARSLTIRFGAPTKH